MIERKFGRNLQRIIFAVEIGQKKDVDVVDLFVVGVLECRTILLENVGHVETRPGCKSELGSGESLRVDLLDFSKIRIGEIVDARP